MIPILPIIGGGAAAIFGAASAVAGWAWDKVVQGVFTWFAEGLLLLIEFVWGLLDTATTPRLTDDWFVNGVVATLAPIALFVTVAMMLMGGIHGALAGRPELIGDTVLAGVRGLFGTAMTLVVLDTLIRFADVISDAVWVQARPNTRDVLDSLVEGVLGGAGWGATFLGPLAVLLGMIGMIVTTILLFMRSTLLYFVAAFAPLVWSSSVLPMMRGGVRRMVHLAVALVFAKPAIVISLAVGMQLLTAAPMVSSSDSNVAGVGTLLTGFFCFAVASVSPWVVFKLLPVAEGAAVSSGIAGGWARGAMTGAQAAMMVKSMGASQAASAATKAIPQAAGTAAAGGGFSAPSGGAGGPGVGGAVSAGRSSGGGAGAASTSTGNGRSGNVDAAGAAPAPSPTSGVSSSASSSPHPAGPSSGSPAPTPAQAGDDSATSTAGTSTVTSNRPPRRVVITSSSSRSRDDTSDGATTDGGQP